MLTSQQFSFSERLPFLWTVRNFTVGGKTLAPKGLLNSEYTVSVKMSWLDFIVTSGISESWHAFHESKFNIYFSISSFEILLNLKHLFLLLIFIATIYQDDFCTVLQILLLDPQYGFEDVGHDIFEYLDLKLHW